MEIKSFDGRFRTDPSRETKGVEVHLGEDFHVMVARSGNRASVAKYRELMSDPAVALASRANNLTDEQMNRIVIEVTANCILVGWRGLTQDGKEVPYSVAKAKELLAVPDFAREIAR